MPKVTLYDLEPSKPDMLKEILAGLSGPSKSIPPKYLYDQRGSELFESITQQPEYYLTRAEEDILATYSEEISQTLGSNLFLVEFGSGSSGKTRALLSSIKPQAYMPIDISKQHLQLATRALSEEYPWLDIRPACADYSQDFELPWVPPNAKPIVFFPGSSVGNFELSQAQACLERISRLVGQDGGLLIGVDRTKTKDTLNAAYNDAGGVTAAFSLNILSHINHTLNSNFVLDCFAHEAHYNDPENRVEIYLRSLVDQQVCIEDHHFHFQAGERILIEYSHKYTTESFLKIAEKTGFVSKEHWMDAEEYFSVFYLVAS